MGHYERQWHLPVLHYHGAEMGEGKSEDDDDDDETHTLIHEVTAKPLMAVFELYLHSLVHTGEYCSLKKYRKNIFIFIF